MIPLPQASSPSTHFWHGARAQPLGAGEPVCECASAMY